MPRHFGNKLAGAAGSGAAVGPGLLFDDEGNVINHAGPLAIWQSRPELNGFEGDIENNKINKDYWLIINGCKTLPEISILGENNFAFYKGEKADLCTWTSRTAIYGQTFDDAEMIWTSFFPVRAGNRTGG